MNGIEEFIQVLKHNPSRAYDFICENYYRMSKDELKDITKELIFAIHTRTTEEEHDEILNDVAEELENFYVED
jgi:hypothetical protein